MKPIVYFSKTITSEKIVELYKKLGYKEVSIVPCVFNGIPDVNLVCLEKHL